MPPRILAIDATEQQCSLAVTLSNGEIASCYEIQPRKHSELILPFVDSIIQKHKLNPSTDFDSIAVSAGPGAFTGVRIGCSIAQGLAYGWQLPIIPVVSLEALAISKKLSEITDSEVTETLRLTVLDARLGEVYAAMYICTTGGDDSRVQLEPVIAPCLLKPKDLGLLLELELAKQSLPVVAVGGGLCYFQDTLKHILGEAITVDKSVQVSAEAVLRIAEYGFLQGDCINAMDLEPNYLRKAMVN